MKKNLLIAVVCLMSLPAVLFGQDLYGPDIMPDTSSKLQNVKAIEVAPDGAIFVLNTYSTGGFGIFKSTDNGHSFNLYVNQTDPAVYNFMDLVIAGGPTDYKLFLGGYNPDYHSIFIAVFDYGSTSFTQPYLKELTTNGVHGLSMASDYKSPALGSSPYSVAMVTTERYGYDTLRYIYSTDGGTNWLETKPVTTSRFLEKVSIAYGQSSGYYFGRYNIAYEDFASSPALHGHIGFIYENNGVGSGFTAPYWLDSLISITSVGSTLDNCRNPHIATSYGLVDNDSLNYTTVITFDRYFTNGDWDMHTFINKNTADFFTSEKRWERFDIDNGDFNTFGSDIAYNPANNKFSIAYFDSTNNKLAHVEIPLNIAPGVVTQTDNFCNYTNQLSPNPEVHVNISPTLNRTAFAWTENVFALQFTVVDLDTLIIPEGIEETEANSAFSFYPNPIANDGIVRFDMVKTEKVSIKLINMLGQQVASIYEGQAPQGLNTVTYSAANLPAGTYMMTYQSAAKNTGRLIVVAH